MSEALRIAVAGNPNVGKTSLVNHLTGARFKVGNYPGVTVERREASVLAKFEASRPLELIDLPGLYSLTPMSEDEAVAFRVLAGDEGAIDAVLLVVDASNLARNLYLFRQIRELGLPCVVALNMVDAAREAGLDVDPARLADACGVPVVPTIGRTGEGAQDLVAALAATETGRQPFTFGAPAEALARCLAVLEPEHGPARARWWVAAAAADALETAGVDGPTRSRLDELGPEVLGDAVRALVDERYAGVDGILAQLELGSTQASSAVVAPAMTRSERVDRVLTHRVWGPLVFLAVMAFVFQSIFTWADPLMGLIETAMGFLGDTVGDALGPGLLTDLLQQGVVAGVGNVIVFVPQIGLLFLFIGLLEDSGYMARAAFIVDRLMASVGLNGKAFVPLLSGFACAIPAIMGTRTIRRFRDRLITILMIPFMSCSARLPIYALLIGAFFDENARVLGPFTQGGLILLGMYLLGTVSALALGAVYGRTIAKGPTPTLVLELPPYRPPRIVDTVRAVLDRVKEFLKEAGTIILAATIVLWGLLTFPQVDPTELPEGETAIEHSIGGQVGKAMEPALAPMGQDWRVGVGILGSFAAREVLVTTMGLVYGIEEEALEDDDAPLREKMADTVDPSTGKPVYSPLSALALMVFFVYACQCMSTLAVVKRETRGWKWPLFMFASMTVIAYVAAVLVFQIGTALGYG